MIGHRGPRVTSVLLLVGVLVLAIGHGVALYYGASRVGLPMVIGGAVLALVVMRHLGLVGRLIRHLRRRDRGPRD